MEFEVHGVPGIRDCFAALPLNMIEALQGQQNTHIFKAILELRSLNAAANQGPWYLAWAGAASVSSAIEISQRLADCTGIPCGTRFRVRALRDVAHAGTVELEPATEDDWEILELNAGFVEDHILTQVGVLFPGQEFPIWVEGGTILMLRVISTHPKQLVQLVPGSELVIAPKLRKISSAAPKLVPSRESSNAKALLRIQSLHPSLMQPLDSMHCSCAPTTVVFVSEQTAKEFSFRNGQLVAVSNINSLRMKKQDSEKEKTRNLKGNADFNKVTSVVLILIYCDFVAKGHAMLASALCHFIGAPDHSRIEVKSYLESSMGAGVSGILAPVNFRSTEGLTSDILDKLHDKAASLTAISENISSEWEKHKRFLGAVFQWTPEQQIENDIMFYDSKALFVRWLSAQMKAISKHLAQQPVVIPIMEETILEFSVGESAHGDMENNTTKTLHKECSGCHFKSSSEMLVFLLSLQDHNEKTTSSETDTSDSSFSTSMKCILVDIRGIESNNGKDENIIPAIKIVKAGHPQYVTTSLRTNSLKEKRHPTLRSLPWLEEAASSALQRLHACLCPKVQAEFYKLGLPSPGYVLLYGPPACGKTKLALAIAKELEMNPSLLCHKVIVKCGELVGEQAQAIRVAIQEAVVEALQCAPSLIILDDLDMAIPSNRNSEGGGPATSSLVLAEYLSDLLDTFRLIRRHQYDRFVAFLALAKEVSGLPPSLCSSGRFDLQIALSAPATRQRASILAQELEHRGLICEDDIISEIASKCDGYDTADLEVLVDRAVHAAAPRLLVSHIGGKIETFDGTRRQDSQKQKFGLLKEDFEQALDGFLPVSMRDIAKPSSKSGPLTWKDIGGLNDTCQTLKEMLELPVKYSKIFQKAPLRLRTGVLLYGPPGCGKTHVVGIAAAACSLRLVSVKGPEILNKYIGASEQGVRDLFAKASAAAPCILFFDEFDAIAPKRGHDNTGVTDRVVNQLLTELDGVEALNGVFVFAATSRPDLLDAALLRPGRLDRLLLCDFPSASERLEILEVLSRKLPLADDVNLDLVASLTENFSGADLQAVLSDAQLEAVHNFLSHETIKDASASESPNRPIISMEALKSVLLRARPSVSDHERRRLYSIYDSFISSRSSISEKVRDAKGKRATLA